MSALSAHRRVVTGLNAAGKSCVIIDGDIARPASTSNLVWQSSLPADNAGSADAARPFDIAAVHHDGSNLLLIEFAPGTEPGMHVTDTLDYFVMLAGQVVLELDAGAVTLFPGDFVVNRGVMHGWRNDGPDPAVLAAITVPSLPVGGGRTI
jgi:quercetin dioxygenase-like cupin family protein